MEQSASLFAIVKLLCIFGAIIVCLRFRVRLWMTIASGSLATAVITGLSPLEWPGVVYSALTERNFVFLCAMIVLILALSGVQEATGQSRKLVQGLERYLHKPRLRLVIFPALVGLLPMPGGALFSCPMIKAAADGMGISDQKKALVNYWFRHIWELAWPLYPGYILICSLLEMPLSRLWMYTGPLVFFAFGIGWFFFMRELAGSQAMREHEAELCRTPNPDGGETLFSVLMNCLPILVTLVGAGIFGLLFDLFAPQLPGQLAFCCALIFAIGVAVYQGKGNFSKPLRSIFFSPGIAKMLLLVVMVFIFKETIGASGLVESLSGLGSSSLAVVLMFFFLPLVSGLLTGVMVGFVGLCFPVLLGILSHSTLQEYTIPLVIMGLILGNAGQLLSPVHVCLLVTCEFFTTALPRLWTRLVRPTSALVCCGLLWVGILLLLGVRQ